MAIKAIFDQDGVIIDTERWHRIAFNDTFKHGFNTEWALNTTTNFSRSVVAKNA